MHCVCVCVCVFVFVCLCVCVGVMPLLGGCSKMAWEITAHFSERVGQRASQKHVLEPAAGGPASTKLCYLVREHHGFYLPLI